MHSEVSKAQELLGRVDKWHLKNSQINIDIGDTADSSLPGKLIGTVPAWTSCFNPYPCSLREAAGFVRPKPPLPEMALTKGLWGACDLLQTKDYWKHSSGEIKRHQEKNPPFLAKMLAPVRLVAAAPPLREASAGGWQRARGRAYINGNENPFTL